MRRATEYMGIPNGTGGFLPTLSMRRATALCFSTTFSAIFLPTLSMRRATRTYCHLRRYDLHFYPRSPCGERRAVLPPLSTTRTISTHALHAESDIQGQIDAIDALISTHALHAESDPFPECYRLPVSFISTHALHAESDPSCYTTEGGIRYFYPRSPCGERRAAFEKPSFILDNFYPRSPCGERRNSRWINQRGIKISTHALHAESDVSDFPNL